MDYLRDRMFADRSSPNPWFAVPDPAQSPTLGR
jgi:hypothetical protein